MSQAGICDECNAPTLRRNVLVPTSRLTGVHNEFEMDVGAVEDWHMDACEQPVEREAKGIESCP